MRRVLMIFVGVAVLSLSLFAAHHTVADQVIAVTKAQWAAEMKNDVATAMKNVADDYTEFNPDYPAAIYPTHLCGLVRLQTGKLTKHVHEARYNPCHPLVINDLRPVL